MSGTSADGIDIALTKISGIHRIYVRSCSITRASISLHKCVKKSYASPNKHPSLRET